MRALLLCWAVLTIWRIWAAVPTSAPTADLQLLPGKREALWTPCRNEAVWTPSEIPMGRLKAMWFGATRSGPTPPQVLELLARHHVAGFGWQMGFQPASTSGAASDSIRHGEVLQHNAVSHARAYLESIGNNHTMLFMYRQVQIALQLFRTSGLAASNTSNLDFWLHDVARDTLCLAEQPWNTWDPFWNFSNPAATEYWLDVFVEQLVQDKSLTGGHGAVFFDEVDQGTCGYRQDSSVPSNTRCSFSDFDGVALQKASNAMLGKTVRKLNRVGIVPILSLDNLMRNATRQHHVVNKCPLPEDDLIEELRGTTWARFYEGFPRVYWQDDSPEVWASSIDNAILEAQAGIPAVLHYSSAKCLQAADREVPNEGRMGGPIEFLVAAYLVVQGPGTTLSISDDWYDANYCWWPEFDVDFGIPLGPPKRQGLVWVRTYTRAEVTVNLTETWAGEVVLHAPVPVPTLVPTTAPTPAKKPPRLSSKEVLAAKTPSNTSTGDVRLLDDSNSLDAYALVAIVAVASLPAFGLLCKWKSQYSALSLSAGNCFTFIPRESQSESDGFSHDEPNVFAVHRTIKRTATGS